MKVHHIFNRLKDPIVRTRIDAEYGIGKLESLFFKNWFNPFATLWVNFRSFPFFQAIRFPLWVYGRPRFYSLSGKMKIANKVKPGMIKFNIVHPGAPGKMSTQTEISNVGTILFHGPCEIGTGNKIVVTYGAFLELGKNLYISDNITLVCYDHVKIGDKTRIAIYSKIMDTNYHFMADLGRGTIAKRSKPIEIGSYVWVCNYASITMGAKIPDYAIVGSNTLANRDYSESTGGCLIAGQPGKVVKNDIVRVFNPKIEQEMFKYWQTNDSAFFPIEGRTLEEMIGLKD